MIAESIARFQAVRARELGVPASAFATNELTIVERPAEALEPYVLLALTMGTGTVVSVEPRYLDWARDNPPEPHYRAFFNAFLLPLVEHAANDGDTLTWRGPSLGFLLDTLPVERSLPEGFRLTEVDRKWRAGQVESGAFSNALGDPGDAFVDTIWQFGLALVASDGSPAAVAGAYNDGDGVLEIGVDVARDLRGQGLARAAVSAMTARILELGALATYYCAPTNIRSERTALACGFLPAFSQSRVNRKKAENVI